MRKNISTSDSEETLTKAEEKKTIHKWIVVFVGMIEMALSYALTVNCFSLYIIPVTEELGFTRRGFTFCSTLVSIAIVVLCLLSERLYKAIDYLKLIRIAAVLMPVLYFLFSYCSSLVSFYVVSFALGICTFLLSFIPFTKLISEWFSNNRGLAIGICFMGTGLGGMIFNSLGGKWIEIYGWRDACRIISGIMTLSIPLMLIFMKKPEEGIISVKADDERAVNNEKNTHKSIFSDRKLLAFFAFAILIGIGSFNISSTAVTRLCDLGFDAIYSSNVSALCFGAMAVGKVLVGRMFDKFGSVKSIIISMIAMYIGIIGLIFSGNKIFHIAVALGFLLGNPVSSVSLPRISEEFFEKDMRDRANGFANAATFIGVALEPFYMNYIYDKTGTYTLGYILTLLLLLCVIFCIMTITGKNITKKIN